jgi:hypothetical protein
MLFNLLFFVTAIASSPIEDELKVVLSKASTWKQMQDLLTPMLSKFDYLETETDLQEPDFQLAEQLLSIAMDDGFEEALESLESFTGTKDSQYLDQLFTEYWRKFLVPEFTKVETKAKGFLSQLQQSIVHDRISVETLRNKAEEAEKEEDAAMDKLNALIRLYDDMREILEKCMHEVPVMKIQGTLNVQRPMKNLRSASISMESLSDLVAGFNLQVRDFVGKPDYKKQTKTLAFIAEMKEKYIHSIVVQIIGEGVAIFLAEMPARKADEFKRVESLKIAREALEHELGHLEAKLEASQTQYARMSRTLLIS